MSARRVAKRTKEPIVDFPDDSDRDSECDGKGEVDIEELEIEQPKDKFADKNERGNHQIPILLWDGSLLKASFSSLEDPLPPVWSVFRQRPGPSQDVVNIRIEKDANRAKLPEEKDIAELWSEMQELGALPQAPEAFPETTLHNHDHNSEEKPERPEKESTATQTQKQGRCLLL